MATFKLAKIALALVVLMPVGINATNHKLPTLIHTGPNPQGCPKGEVVCYGAFGIPTCCTGVNPN